MGNRKRGEKATEQLNAVLVKAGGRPLQRSAFPKDLEAQVIFLKRRGGEGYMRLAAMARSKGLKAKKPELYAELQKYLWEIAYGKAKQQIGGEVSLPIKVTFELVKTPQELEKPSLIAEPVVKELPGLIEINAESIRVEAPDSPDAVETA